LIVSQLDTNLLHTVDQQMAVQDQQSQIQQQKLQAERERVASEANKAQAIIAAEKEAAERMASARVEAEALAANTEARAKADVAMKEAELKQLQLAAENDMVLAQKRAEQQVIENKMHIAEAEAKAAQKAAALTAEETAVAAARNNVARMELETAQTRLEAAKITAAGRLEIARSDAEGKRLMAESEVKARFPGLSPEQRAECLLTMAMLEAQTEISKRTQAVYHTLDPNDGQKIYERQMSNMMHMTNSIRGFGHINPMSAFVNPAGMVGNLGVGNGLNGLQADGNGGGNGGRKAAFNVTPPTMQPSSFVGYQQSMATSMLQPPSSGSSTPVNKPSRDNAAVAAGYELFARRSSAPPSPRIRRASLPSSTAAAAAAVAPAAAMSAGGCDGNPTTHAHLPPVV
jgi:hypothetical protein